MEKAPANKLKLNILTPRGVKFEREADFLTMYAHDGELGILPGHSPMTSALGDGILNIYNDDSVEKFALFQGLVDVEDDIVSIYTTIAQHPDEIDLRRAQLEKDEALAALNQDLSELEMRAKTLEIRRALVRIEVAVQSSDPDYFEPDHGSAYDIDDEDEEDEE